MREVEVKYRVSDPDRIMRLVADRGAVWSPATRQDDQAYAPADWRYGMSKLGVPFGRLRTENQRHTFTVKVPRANEMACIEHETEVADRGGMHAALLTMGWVPTVRIVKTRRTAHIAGMLLCLDDVEHAGRFLEVETMISGDEDEIGVQARMGAFVVSLGFTGEPVSESYDSLVRASMTRV